MEKKFDLDDELEMLLDDQLMKEAELLEKVLFADDSFEDYQETPEERKASFEKLVNRLKAEGIYRGDTVSENVSKENASKDVMSKDADKEDIEKVIDKENGDNVDDEKEHKESSDKVVTLYATEKTSKNKVRRKFGRSLGKVASIVIVSGLCVFAASMTSEANRNYFLHNMRIMTGQDTRDVTGNDETNERVNEDEYFAIAEIERELQIDVPEFLYRPESFRFITYEAESIAGYAWMEFKYKDNIIIFKVEHSADISASEVCSVHGNKIEEIQVLYDDITVELLEVKDLLEEIPNYYATWKKDNINYSLSGRIELNELKKILMEMVYRV